MHTIAIFYKTSNDVYASSTSLHGDLSGDFDTLQSELEHVSTNNVEMDEDFVLLSSLFDENVIECKVVDNDETHYGHHEYSKKC